MSRAAGLASRPTSRILRERLGISTPVSKPVRTTVPIGPSSVAAVPGRTVHCATRVSPFQLT